MKVAVIGASGYTGLELLRILLRHPGFEIAVATSEQYAGQALGDAFPALRGQTNLILEALDADAIAGRVDIAFTALPHATAAPTVAKLRAASVKVVDLSADTRFRDLATYEAWYGAHKAPELIGQAVYGIPELSRAALPGAKLAAAPGCYPTSVLLPLLPFLREGVVELSPIIVDSKSGVSGAGRKLDTGFLFAELDENCKAYKVGYEHRHVPEMEQEASAVAGAPVQITFVPHLLPTIRGIVTSVYLRPKESLSAADARALLEATYAGERFVRVLPEGETPSLAAVRGSNYCDVTAFADERTGTLIVLSALDNLCKGSSGQAIQCANLMCGYPEEQGLLDAPISI